MHGSNSLTGFQFCHGSKINHVSIVFQCFFSVVAFPLLICYLCKTRCFLCLIYCMCLFFSFLFIFFILLHFFLFISFYFIFSHFFSVPKPSWSNTLLIWCLEIFWWISFGFASNLQIPHAGQKLWVVFAGHWLARPNQWVGHNPSYSWTNFNNSICPTHNWD